MTRGRDPVRDLLRARGAAEHVVLGGLAGLVAAWERFAVEVAVGYRHGLDDYLNDVDVRELIHAALAVAPADERRALRRRVRATDERMRTYLVPEAHCLWGPANAAEHGWSAGKNWWYFMRPARTGARFAADLERTRNARPL